MVQQPLTARCRIDPLVSMQSLSLDSRRVRPKRTRTRTGCLTCRRRRKKCDERKPTCIACERNKVSCTWDPNTQHKDDQQAKAAALARSKAHQFPYQAQPQVFLEVFKAACAQTRLRTHPELYLQVSKNIHHYTSVTAETLYALTPPFMEGLWTRMVLGEAQAYPFVMDSVDAITSFHCAYLYPEDAPRYVRLARLSNASGLAQFRSSVSRIDGHNATATLAFTFFQIIICIASSFALRTYNPDEILDSLRDLLVALRGFYQLQPASCSYITDKAIIAWLTHQPDQPSADSPRHNPDILACLSQLAMDMENLGASFPDEEKNHCRAALVQLYSFFAGISLEPRNWEVLFTWPVMLSNEFLNLIMARHPLALIISAHWAVFVFRYHHWLLDRWAGHIFYGVACSVGPELLHMLQGLQEDTVPRPNETDSSITVANSRLEMEMLSIPHHCKNPLVDRK